MVRAVELCDQAYVRVSSESGSVAVPSRLTVEPSGTVWSPPASTVGAVFAESVMVTVTLSVTVAVPSDTSRVNSTGVSSETLGAAKEVSSAESSSSVMERAELCDQEYVRVSSESGSVAVPSRRPWSPRGRSGRPRRRLSGRCLQNPSW